MSQADFRTNGEPWLDTAGNVIQAHGGGILHHGGMYYWYGENKSGMTLEAGACGQTVDMLGVNAYRSRDLVRWEPLGTVLQPVFDNPCHDLHPSRVVERPKVVHNPQTGMFVMWIHSDDRDYKRAATGVAIAEKPEGPFRYLYSLRPQGLDSRDQTVFVDHDGAAYHVCSSNWNATVLFSRLSGDFRSLTGHHHLAFHDRYMEAQAIARHQGRYWMLASGCTGWDPNEARSAWADSLVGPWTETGNPCEGPGHELTFGCQSTFLLPLPDGRLVAMFDWWNRQNLGDSRYVWLEAFVRDGRLVIPWSDRFYGLTSA